ncbi:MAG: pro-sigmaK processing inhibitor BofA family protein [Clostridia bacterium]|nr:pro-sigmaK processing inhibitor BofA family protein [Clostridia bacterium]
MAFDFGAISAYIIGLAVLFVFWKIFTKPFKWLIRLVVNGILGGLLLYIINSIGFAGLTIDINIITSLIAGILGIPGVILLFVLQLIL